MKKIIALFLSALIMFSCLGVMASATTRCYPYAKPCPTTTCPAKPVPTTRPCPTKPAPTTTTRPEPTTTVVNNVTNITNNVTNNNITIMPEEDPSTIFGFLYRVIKTIVPYLFKILSLINVEVSFGGNNACNNCGSSNGCNCNNGNVGGGDYIIVIPSTNPSVTPPTGNIGGGSADSDSADSDSDSLLGGLFGDLFA